MLDDYVKSFCYRTFGDYRNLFWDFCMSLYEKEKASFPSQYGLYYVYAGVIYDSTAD